MKKTVKYTVLFTLLLLINACGNNPKAEMTKKSNSTDSVAKAQSTIDDNTKIYIEGGLWWDGDVFLIAQKKENNKYIMRGGNLHEGGCQLTLELIKGNLYRRTGEAYEDDDKTVLEGGDMFGTPTSAADKVQLFVINNTQFMSLKNVKGSIIRIFEKINHNEKQPADISAITIKSNAEVFLHGKYKAPDNSNVIIDAEAMTFEGLGNKKQKFTHPPGDYDFIALNIILLNNGKGFQIRPEYGKLILTPVKIKLDENGSVEYDEEGKVEVIGKDIILAKVQEEAGYYKIFSDKIILPGTLNNFTWDLPKSFLNAIKNEIYARQGYKFSKPEIQKIFTSQSWYKPVEDNKSMEFSPIEKINLDLIKETLNNKN